MQHLPDISDETTWKLLEESTPKYDLISKKPEHHLFWLPSYLSIPVRSIFEYPVLSESDLYGLDKVIEYNCHLFNMADDEQARLFCVIKDRAYSGWYVIVKEETKWNSDNNMLVWLEWAQQYCELAKPIKNNE